MSNSKSAAGDEGAAESKAALTVSCSSQHLRFDLCLEMPADSGPHSEEKQQRLLQDAAASLSVSGLQVIHTYQVPVYISQSSISTVRL